MVHMLSDSHIRRVSELVPFLESLHMLRPHPAGSRRERAEWIYARLVRFKYQSLGKAEKGILIEYLRLMTGCSLRTVKAHIAAYKQGQKLCRDYARNRFPARYTNADRELLAETDTLHGRLNGKSTKNLLLAEYLAGDDRYARLSHISCAHIYNLRQSRVYHEQVQVQSKTQSVQTAIGERRRPEPDGKPGYLRVDTVHQGDSNDGEKGVYHINLVDEVTQYQVVVAVEGISEACLQPVLETALALFPFAILNFHSDNGSEFINKTVARLLNKLLVSQTKSRPRKSNDNALAESKNGSTIRKHLGHWHIPQQFAPRLNKFYREHFIPYLNFHRPCAFPAKKALANGKVKVVYPQENYMTPLNKLFSLPHVERCLKSGITAAGLRQQAMEKSPNQAAREMQEAKKAFLAIALQKQGVLD